MYASYPNSSDFSASMLPSDSFHAKQCAMYKQPLPSMRPSNRPTASSRTAATPPSMLPFVRSRGVDRHVSLPRERHYLSSDGSSSAADSSHQHEKQHQQQQVLVETDGCYNMIINCEPSNGQQSCSSSSCASPSIRMELAEASTQTAAAAAVVQDIVLPAAHNTFPPRTFRCTESNSLLSFSTERSQRSRSTTSSGQPPVFVELTPTVRVPLRGATETQKAIDNGFYVQCECVGCNCSDVFCILDCDYFLCPDCRFISPNPLSAAIGAVKTPSAPSERKAGGLGLGFRME